MIASPVSSRTSRRKPSSAVSPSSRTPPGGKRYPFYFVQFVSHATATDFHPDDAEVREARWFDALPDDMAFREDYIEDHRTWRENFRRGAR